MPDDTGEVTQKKSKPRTRTRRNWQAEYTALQGRVDMAVRILKNRDDEDGAELMRRIMVIALETLEGDK